jgi:hypothetical protein
MAMQFLIEKTDDLPRQARDTHPSETLKPRGVSISSAGAKEQLWIFNGTSAAVRNTPFLASFVYKNGSFTKTGSGQA